MLDDSSRIMKIENMKRILLLIAMSATLLFAGCGNDDAPNVVDPDLVGVWKATTFIVSECENEEDNTSIMNWVCTSFDCLQFAFDEDSRYIGTSIDDSRVRESGGTYSAENGILSIAIVSSTTTTRLVGSYAIDNDILTYDYESNGCNVHIVMKKS